MHKSIAGVIVALVIAQLKVSTAHAAPPGGPAIGSAALPASALIPVWHWGTPHRTNCARVCGWHRPPHCRIVCREQLGSPGRPSLRGKRGRGP